MANLETLIYQQLTGDSTLQSDLVTFNGQPAVFFGNAPGDTDQGWDNGQFPRINYSLDRQQDPERKVQATMMIEVWTLLDSGVTPDALESQVRAVLDGAVYHPDNDPVTAIKWASSAPWTAARQTRNDADTVLGFDIQFDVYSFTAQETFEPDPIAAMNSWTSEQLPGLQVDPTSWQPTTSGPAIYWRHQSVQVAEMHPTFAWLDAVLMGHVLGQAPADRTLWIRKVVNQVALKRQAVLGDGSPVFFNRISANSEADSLSTGQIRLTARYGVLLDELAGPVIQTVSTSGAVKATNAAQSTALTFVAQ